MLTFGQYLESRSTSHITAVMELAQAIQAVFKKYSLGTRQDAWAKIKGSNEIEKLLHSPEHGLSKFRTL